PAVPIVVQGPACGIAGDLLERSVRRLDKTDRRGSASPCIPRSSLAKLHGGQPMKRHVGRGHETGLRLKRLVLQPGPRDEVRGPLLDLGAAAVQFDEKTLVVNAVGLRSERFQQAIHELDSLVFRKGQSGFDDSLLMHGVSSLVTVTILPATE